VRVRRKGHAARGVALAVRGPPDVAAAAAAPTAAAAVEEAFVARRGAIGCSARRERRKAEGCLLGAVPRQRYGRDAVGRDVGHDREPPLRMKMRQRRGCQRHAPAGLGQAAEHHQVHGHRHGRPARELGRVGQQAEQALLEPMLVAHHLQDGVEKGVGEERSHVKELFDFVGWTDAVHVARRPHLLADGGAERQQRHLAATAVLQAFHHADGLRQRVREVERVVVRGQCDPLARLQEAGSWR